MSNRRKTMTTATTKLEDKDQDSDSYGEEDQQNIVTGGTDRDFEDND